MGEGAVLCKEVQWDWSLVYRGGGEGGWGMGEGGGLQGGCRFKAG